MEERLQKLMSQAGLGSRRDCEALIEAGRVTVNGRVIHLGDKADPATDTILVDGRPLKPAEQKVYIAIYKPRGVLSAVESPDPRPTVRDLVPTLAHVYPVGRLDVDSEGLMLLTNDGDMANRLTHPRYGHEKEYRVLVARRPDDEQLETWRRGVVLEDGYRTQPADVRLEGMLGKGAWLRVILREGRKRQIRETGSRIGLPVVKIIRVRLGSLTLGVLKPREWRFLTSQEVAALKGQTPAVALSPASSPIGLGGRGRRPGGPPSGHRPFGNRPPGDRPSGSRPPGDRPSGSRPPGSRPPGSRPAGNRPPGDRPPGDRPPGDRPPGDRPPFHSSNRPASVPYKGGRPVSGKEIETDEGSQSGARRRFRREIDAPPGRRSSRPGGRSERTGNETDERPEGASSRRLPFRGPRSEAGQPPERSGRRPAGGPGRAGRPPARRGAPGKPGGPAKRGGPGPGRSKPKRGR